eukprot:COSAG04_NODE_17485_length_468_cov_0.842818_1_plen_122_part_10
MCLGDGSHGSSCGEAPSDCIFSAAQALYKRLVFSSGFESGWLGGWCRFVKTCCDAYQVLRENRDLFIGLFSLMLSAGIPELQYANQHPTAHPATQSLLLLLCLLCGHSNFRCRHRLLFVKND